MLGALWLAVSPTALARANPESFDIAAQAMPSALRLFAAQAHVQLLFDYKALARLRTGPVRGRMQPADALALLLKGSGYTFQQVNERTIAIQPASAAADPPPAADGASGGQAPAASAPALAGAPGGNTLASVVVTAKFISTAGSSAMKMNLPARDTPFSISTYSQGFMNAVEAQKVDSLYPYMTGIQSAGITGYDLVFRGFQSGANDFNSILVDGLPGLATRFGSPVTIGVERIDVVRGPASVLNGEEQPGGFINLITKKPEAQPLYELSASGTAYDGAGIGLSDKPGFDVAADMTGPIAGSDRFLYRLIVDDANKDSFRTYSFNRNAYVAPSFTWVISDATKLTLAYEYQHLLYSYDTYLVAPNGNIDLVAPITTRYQQPGDWELEHGNVLSTFFSHRFANGFSWHIGTRDVWHEDEAHGFDVVAVLKGNQLVSRRARGQLNKRRFHFADTHLDMPFQTVGVRHDMVIGATAGLDSLDANRGQFYNAPSTGKGSLNINIYTPDYAGVPSLSSLPLVLPAQATQLNDRYTVTESFGAYMADMMTFSSHWKGSIGLRYSRDRQWIKELRIAGVPGDVKVNDKVLPMGGIVYQPDKHWSFYASYSASYVPPPAQAVDINDRNSFVPTSAHQVEVGEKDEFLHGRLTSTLAVYRIDEQNTLSTFSCQYGTCYSQVGKARSKGGEFEVNARPLPNWQLTAGAAYTDARITASDNPVQVNARLPNVPLLAEHLWSRYDISASALRGFGFGLGIIHQGERKGVTPTSATAPVLELPAYTRTDAALYYDRGDYIFTFKVENVFDKTYYQSAGFQGNINLLPGDPRLFTLSARALFE
jgi:iron complex outermembrane receptor protein